MDVHNDWIKAQQELSKASKAVHYWNGMSAELRSRMSTLEYRASTDARRRLRLADRLCQTVASAKRAEGRT